MSSRSDPEKKYESFDIQNSSLLSEEIVPTTESTYIDSYPEKNPVSTPDIIPETSNPASRIMMPFEKAVQTKDPETHLTWRDIFLNKKIENMPKKVVEE